MNNSDLFNKEELDRLAETAASDDVLNAAWEAWEHLTVKDLKKVYKDGFLFSLEKAISWIRHNNENGGCLYDNWEESFYRAMVE